MITRITLADEATSRGLAPFTFEPKSNVVVLAGPNGSGKTRYLQAIYQLLPRAQRAKMTDSVVTPEVLDALRQGKEPNLAVASRIKNSIKIAPQDLIKIRTSVAFADEVNEQIDIIHAVGFLTIPKAQSPSAQVSQMQSGLLVQAIEQTRSINLDNAFSQMFFYAAAQAQTLYAIRHPDYQHSESLRSEHNAAITFNEMLQILLGSGLTHDYQERAVVPIFRGQLFRPELLSDGERLLFSWAIQLHSARLNLERAILFVDEPETHLHPEACIRALDRLRHAVGPHGQIWIATHSLSLIAYAGMESLFLVRNHAASYAGRQVTEVVESLLGGSEGRTKLNHFLRDASETGALTHLVQCIFSPAVAGHKEGDLQEGQFVRVVRRRLESNNPITILDYAAGRGRFAAALGAYLSAQGAQIDRGRVRYVAYTDREHSTPDEREELNRSLRTIGTGAQGQVLWDDIMSLRAGMPKQFDLIVLSNTLHEIEPREYVDTFRAIQELLADDGSLLIMEERIPSVGELPHPGGYLLLEEDALRKLFGADAVCVLSEGTSRSMVAEIPKRFVSISRDAIIKTLDFACEQALRKIEQLRKSPERTQKTGWQHAHWAMQHTNATLGLKALGVDKH